MFIIYVFYQSIFDERKGEHMSQPFKYLTKAKVACEKVVTKVIFLPKSVVKCYRTSQQKLTPTL